VSGNVVIGTTAATAKLEVKGAIKCGDLTVDVADLPDYVFDRNYKLPDLQTLESQIQKEGHLPGMPSAGTVGKSGMSVSGMVSKQLGKIEELTLYMIEMKKEQKALAEMCQQLMRENQALKARLDTADKR
jgi:hypothetical protein